MARQVFSNLSTHKNRPLTKCLFALFGCGGVTRDVFDVTVYRHSLQCLRCSHRQCRGSLQARAHLVLCLLFIPPDGEVAAFKGEVDHLDNCDRRRAHPEADTVAEILDDLRLL